MPRVSVIVPNYNYANYLEQRMNSIFEQGFKDYEIIIIDDGSTDGSRELIEKRYSCRPEVIKIIFNEANSGSVFKQWGKGLESAAGELIWIAESDDFCDSGLLERLVGEFDRDDNCNLAFCRSIVVDSEGHNMKIHPLQTSMEKDFAANGKEFAKRFLKRHNYVVNASSALFKREAAIAAGREFENYKGMGDLIFWLEICMKGTVRFVAEPLNRFRRHDAGQTVRLENTPLHYNELYDVKMYLFRKGIISSAEMLAYRIYVMLKTISLK